MGVVEGAGRLIFSENQTSVFGIKLLIINCKGLMANLLYNQMCILLCPRLRAGTNALLTWVYHVTPSDILLNSNLRLRKEKN